MVIPSLVDYDSSASHEQLKRVLVGIPLAKLALATGLSKHTIVRARRGERVHPRSLQSIKMSIGRIPIRKV